jgi:hypothetical protein
MNVILHETMGAQIDNNILIYFILVGVQTHNNITICF